MNKKYLIIFLTLIISSSSYCTQAEKEPLLAKELINNFWTLITKDNTYPLELETDEIRKILGIQLE